MPRPGEVPSFHPNKDGVYHAVLGADSLSKPNAKTTGSGKARTFPASSGSARYWVLPQYYNSTIPVSYDQAKNITCLWMVSVS